jgi:adenine-specific DNA-methyltransferase
LFQANDIQEGAVVLVARGFRGTTYGATAVDVTRKEFHSATTLSRALASCGVERRREASVIERNPPAVISQRNKKETKSLVLGDILSISLGGVTGDAGYFLMTETQRRELRLPIASLRPALTRARQLVAHVVNDQVWQQLLRNDERVWLFNPPPFTLAHAAVKKYLASGKVGGKCNLRNHKISNRRPWHRTPLPSKVDAFLSGMSKVGPWLCFRKMPRLTASNTLYVASFHNCETDDERAAIALALVSTSVSQQLFSIGRRYADGLLKFEPGDLHSIRFEVPVSAKGAMQTYSRCVSALQREGDLRKARAIADSWL